MTIEEYCRYNDIDNKKNLTDSQIEDFGRNWCVGLPLSQIFMLGTSKDRQNAVSMMRKAIKENKRFEYCFIEHEGVFDDSEKVNNETNFEIWLT